MSRRAASFTQADVARALRAAQQVGPHWRVMIEGSIIHIIRGETRHVEPDKGDDPVVQEEEPESKWAF